jgi:hypothetical protein
VRVATGSRDWLQINAGNLNQNTAAESNSNQGSPRHSLSQSVVQNKPFIVDIDISFLSSSLSSTYPFHSFNHRSLPWPLVLVTRSPTLDILLPTHRCHSNTPNSINNAGVTMMQNPTIATNMVREIQAQHILRPTLPTTTLVNSANSTPAVSITPHPLLLYSLLQFPSRSPLTVNFSLSILSASPRHRGLGLFLLKFYPSSQRVLDRTHVRS